MNTHGVNTIKAHNIGENFGKAVREICKEMNLKTDVEISKEKKGKMLENLQNSLKIATNFDELIQEMDKKDYKITLSENVKIGVSGMRIVRKSDINNESKREYLAGYKLSEITNKLKIKNIKDILEQNNAEKIKKNRMDFFPYENKKEELNKPFKRKF